MAIVLSVLLWLTDSDYHFSIFDLFWFYSVYQIFVILFTQELTFRQSPRTSIAKDNPLTICSIPYTDLRASMINYVLKPWQDSWEKQIYNKLLKKHSLAGTIICSYGQKVLNRGRTGHGGVTHSYLLNNEERPERIPSNSNYSLKHILIDYVDVVEAQQVDYNVKNLFYFAYNSCRRHTFILKFFCF